MLVWIFVENNVNGCLTTMKNRELKCNNQTVYQVSLSVKEIGPKYYIYLAKPAHFSLACFKFNLPDSHT